MTADRAPQTADKYIVRFPDGMRDRIAEAAKQSNRSMNAEVVARLQASFAAPPTAMEGEVFRDLAEARAQTIAAMADAKEARELAEARAKTIVTLGRVQANLCEWIALMYEELGGGKGRRGRMGEFDEAAAYAATFYVDMKPEDYLVPRSDFQRKHRDVAEAMDTTDAAWEATQRRFRRAVVSKKTGDD
ncbi:Arc family DNA-binding protein [Xenophilus azovorans]|uniref:Arc family DNA-binding protein n=1 Tax=Xenophilus azovorans TaxID=151755 RepID=UPI00056F15FC|nr:Arc family DNA-binding protein [Xenophilus azovorans]